MRYKLFGKSGLRVSELALGTMTFGDDWGWGASRQESQKIFDLFADAGGNFIDTANRYTEGTSEKLIGEFIASDRDHFVVATKFTLFDRRDDPNFSGNHRKNMMRSLDTSLKRLGTDYVDILWMHAWDFFTPIEEILRALDDSVRAGKTHYIGVSDTPAWIVSQANAISHLRGWASFVGLQTQYSLVERTSERDLLPMARSLDLTVTAWGALGSGVLTGKYNSGKSEGRAAAGRGQDPRNLEIAQAVIDVAEDVGCSPSQVALNWVRQQPGVMIPLIGARKASQAADNLKCLDFELEDGHLNKLNDVSKIELGFPHDFLASKGARDNVYGGTYDQIDTHRQ